MLRLRSTSGPEQRKVLIIYTPYSHNSVNLCASLLGNEMRRDTRCAHMCGGGRCGFYDGFTKDKKGYIESDSPDKENLIPGLEIQIPFPHSRDVFDLLDVHTRLRLLPLYDRFVVFGEPAFHEALEQAYRKAEVEFRRSPNANSFRVFDSGFEQTYEKLQFVDRWEAGEPVQLVDDHDGGVRCGFHRTVFDNGFVPGPFPGLELYMKNGHFVTKKQVEWLMSVSKDSSNVYVGPYGYDKCPIYFMDILQAQMNRGYFGSATYAIGMADWDTCGSDVDDN